jgi:hypothetical protein
MRNVIKVLSDHPLSHRRPNILWKKVIPAMWAGSWAACGKISISGISNCINYFLSFIAYT